ncbi:putative spermidine/putrescine transport system ATP-binding protein [Pseudomonas sp. ok272]|uniref:ABC transporter ATP-binding protein n=1 Tax=unclassified Pseudomonas TaxID=196821 RepID=UPI0008D3869B|nr:MULTISPECIES: ABC transporter ATP-binding protein [unclassified Pseudomonas]SEM46459.1 putative spermidine/putrescine transport system ATP-binding protein [Pseudomonas sp. ok272]SFM18140.1 putative spermidine/putrescine transport system ATP-binding protein [Pseudomonas sp. ok602]
MTSNNASAFVRFKGVEKSYDGLKTVVKKLDLDVAQGEFLTLLGPSGSGKTTSLMMLAGFETPTQGQIFLEGQAIESVPAHRRGIGMVFQNYALFPHMNVAENMAFPLQVRGMKRHDIETKVKKALAMVRLGDLANRYPAQLSGGQQQRIALARALVFEPTLVLMDEPLGALDKQLREQMQLEIRRLHRELGLTVVFVTHDQAEALTLSDRVAIFNDGVIQQVDTPQALYERPANRFVATFMGDTNVLPGVLDTLGSEGCQVRLDQGTHLAARLTPGLAKGSRTSLSIRSERVILDGDTRYDSRLSGRIEECLYLGDHVRVRLNVAGNDDFNVKVPIAQMQPHWREGLNLPVCWHSSDASALDAMPA